jgi:glycine/D-amino acid oxidase-like deaminating enzyme
LSKHDGEILMHDSTGHSEAAEDQRQLRSGSSPWQVFHHSLPRTPLLADLRCDVAIVGAGITGSFAAEALTRQGLSVVVVDRLMPGRGSTAASTAMLQWEIDRSLTELTELYGLDKAADIYRRSYAATADLCDYIQALGISCLFSRRSSLYLGGGDTGPTQLAREHHLRRQVDLPGDLLDRGTLIERFMMDRPSALFSPGSAEADPLCLSLGLLRIALAQGAVLVEDEVVAYDWSSGSASIGLAGGRTVEARHVVLATGYEMPDFVTTDLHRRSSSWCLATVPQQPGALWRDRALIWESSHPYLYARTTDDGRIVVGGEDQATGNVKEREQLMPDKIAEITSKMRNLWPYASYELAHTWSAEFGETDDGLPLIGPVPGAARVLAAYGYGGNGITFSYMASRILAAQIAGTRRPWFDDFALDRTAS